MFVTFEGPEGAGKSTALLAVAERLRQDGLQVVTTREPGSGDIGRTIREILLHGADLDFRTELLLFLADRAQHVSRIIEPALERGDLVLCDRFADSTLVYQGLARGLDAEFVRRGNAFATAGRRPDLTLLFDLPAESGLLRLKNPDRLDAQPVEFHRRVRAGFLTLAEEEPDRWVKIDALQDPASVASQAGDAILARVRD